MPWRAIGFWEDEAPTFSRPVITNLGYEKTSYRTCKIDIYIYIYIYDFAINTE
jgi:hypothetical protein